MKASLRTLLAGIVDYAGTFPPARLSLEETVRRFIEYRRGEHAWMLGKLVCTPQHLRELPSLCEAIPGSEATAKLPTSLVLASADGLQAAAALVGQPYESMSAHSQRLAELHDKHAKLLMDPSTLTAAERESLEEELASDFAAIERLKALDWSGQNDWKELRQQITNTAIIEAVEVRLLQDDLATFALTASLPLLIQLLPLRNGQASFFYETPRQDWDRNAKFLLARLAERQPEHLRPKIGSESPMKQFGFKLRTGGLEAAAFPSVERVAWVIATCRDGRVPWKATAGLHHPLRHHDEKIGTMMHGFFNVTCAAVLADFHQLDETRIAEILRDESIENFEFRDDGLRWRNLEATNEQIAHCRKHGFLSFGSCSFEEPIEDLQSLGLL